MSVKYVNKASPSELLQSAAEAAAALLPELEQKYADLLAEAKAVSEEIEELRVLARRVSKQSNVDVVVQPALPGNPDSDSKEDAAGNQAVNDLEREMLEKGPVSASEMRRRIEERTGRRWGASTVYNHLKKGKDSGRYINEDNLWRLSNAAKSHMR